MGAIAFVGSYAIGESNFWVGFILLAIAGGAMYAPLWAVLRLVPGNPAAQRRRRGIALINSCGAGGEFVGAYVVGWLNAATGSLPCCRIC